MNTENIFSFENVLKIVGDANMKTYGVNPYLVKVPKEKKCSSCLEKNCVCDEEYENYKENQMDREQLFSRDKDY